MVVVIAVPPHYDADYEMPQVGQGRPLREMVTRLAPYRDELRGQEVRLLAARFAGEGCLYLNGTDPCTARTMQVFIPEQPAGTSVRDVLDDKDINAIYADETITALLGSAWSSWARPKRGAACCDR